MKSHETEDGPPKLRKERVYMVTRKSSLVSRGLHAAIRASFRLLDRGEAKEALSETRQAFEVAAAPRTLLSYKMSIILKLQGHTKRG